MIFSQKQLRLPLICALLIFGNPLFGQGQNRAIISSPDPNFLAANTLFEQTEYAKAAILFENIVESNPSDEGSYGQYLICLVKTNQQDKAIKCIKKRIKKSQQPMSLVVDECWVNTTYPEENNPEKHLQRANDLLDLIISQLKPSAQIQNGNMHLIVSNRFEYLGLKNYAIKVLQNAEDLLGPIPEISNSLAILYLETGNREKGLEKYTNMLLSGMPFETLIPVFETHIIDSLDFLILQKILLKNIQEFPEIIAFSEGLKWTFIKQENWGLAFLYSKSLDKRLKENGSRVYDLGQLCQSNKNYDVAKQCFEYCVNLKQICFDLPLCQGSLIDINYENLVQGIPKKEELIELKNQMFAFENEFGSHESTLNNALQLSQLLIRFDSLFLETTESGILSGNAQAKTLLKKYLSESFHLKKGSIAKVKLALGDVLLAEGDVWSSELLYAQVEKDFKEEELGQFAKFKRAELSFYRGDFDWASMQLDVLKSATTQLISNDAMELALVIIDNLGIDSNYLALRWYSKGLLEEKQHHYSQAVNYLDSVVMEFPGHSLSDEILFVKARMKKDQGKLLEAAELLETLTLAFNFDILADNALYQLGMIYAYQLNEPEKAKLSFEKLIEQYGSSVYIVDARREYRKIRGY